MSYAKVDDVVACFRNLNITSENAAVTEDKIKNFLKNQSYVIDARIGKLYQLPLTKVDNPASWAILAQIETFFVAGIVDDIINSYGEADKKPGWDRRAKDMLNEYAPLPNAKGIQIEPVSRLPDATYIGTPQQKGKVEVSATSGRIFSKGGDNW